MLLADKLSQIKLLDNVDVMEGKCSYRRGQVTKVKSKIEEVEARSLRDIRLKELQRQHQDLLQNLAIHDALQADVRSYSPGILLSQRPSSMRRETEAKKSEPHFRLA